MSRLALVRAALLAGAILSPVARAGDPPSAPRSRASAPGADLRATVADGSEAAVDRPAPRRRYVVAAIGDSITDPRSGGGRYMAALARLCPGSRFDTYGIGGQRTNLMRWRTAQDLFGDGLPGGGHKPGYTHLIVLGGVNDVLAGIADSRLEAAKDNLAAIYRTARSRGVQVVALTVPPISEIAGVHTTRSRGTDAINAWILAQEAAGTVDAVVDVGPILACGDPRVLCPAYRRFFRDVVHWNDAGHERVGDALHARVFSDCE